MFEWRSLNSWFLKWRCGSKIVKLLGGQLPEVRICKSRGVQMWVGLSCAQQWTGAISHTTRKLRCSNCKITIATISNPKRCLTGCPRRGWVFSQEVRGGVRAGRVSPGIWGAGGLAFFIGAETWNSHQIEWETHFLPLLVLTSGHQHR